ncbi:MAG TPA: acyl-CoA dehydrogenase, partial [Thermoanaerobaculia bacterium]|nr:acyl-CoA dehydrogenase [Thermoanaerobaculia bacterium]
AFYAWWYPSRWIGWGAWPRFSEFGSLAGHVRYVDRTARRLARALFHQMARFGPKLERKQATLFRAVDAGADLFAMTAAISFAESLRRTGVPEGERAVELADLFCRNAARRVEARFEALADNDDARKVAVARRVLAGDEEWLESGLLPVSWEASDPADAPPGTAAAAHG